MRTKRYFIVNKPFGVLCQFTDPEGRKTLANLGPFPPQVYPVGRLDYDSEGLVLLSDDGELKYALLAPSGGHSRTYLVQVERIPTESALERLRKGVEVEGKITLTARVDLLDTAPELPERPVPIRFRKNVPTAWIKLVLIEGRNRQVRKMTAAVGHPTLRLVRSELEGLTLDGLQPGQWRELLDEEVEKLRTTVLRSA